ncbi:ROK family protein, partial [Enterobacter hormaechei]|uniref:ROK family protein n=2 Tax=Enterobacterales TaxID=91347 RepID=UPI0020A63358
LARNGNKHAIKAFEHYQNRLAKALAQAVNMLDPDVIVLGGGMSNVDELYE